MLIIDTVFFEFLVIELNETDFEKFYDQYLRSRSVVVITFRLHRKGLGFNPRREHFFFARHRRAGVLFFFACMRRAGVGHWQSLYKYKERSVCIFLFHEAKSRKKNFFCL